MKKNITGKGMAKRKQQARKQQREDLTIGIDVGDRSSSYCILDETGEVLVAGQPEDHASKSAGVLREAAEEPGGDRGRDPLGVGGAGAG